MRGLRVALAVAVSRKVLLPKLVEELDPK